MNYTLVVSIFLMTFILASCGSVQTSTVNASQSNFTNKVTTHSRN